MFSFPLAPEHAARVLVAALRLAYSETQSRDERGRWTDEGSSNPIISKFREEFDEAKGYFDTHFILPDGTRLSHDESMHGIATKQIGIDLYDAISAGVIRYGVDGAEIGAPITHEQAEHLVDSMEFSGRPLHIDVFNKALPRNQMRDSKRFHDRVTPEGVRNWVNQHFLRTNHYFRLFGGPGSGNFGHAGRPGEVGGSGSSGPSSSILAAIQQADGGFTYHAVTGATPSKGFAVSLHKNRERVIAAKDATVDTLARYARENWDLLSQERNFFGGWHNPVDDKVYLDVSTVFDTVDEALDRGADANQLAIFDLAHGQSIPIQKRAAYGYETYPQFDRAVYGSAVIRRFDRALETTPWPRTDYRGVGESESDLRETRALGGPGSGNFGHAGRPGEVGGSGNTLRDKVQRLRMPKTFAPANFDFESQVGQFPAKGKPGIGYFKGEIDAKRHVDVLLDRGDDGRVRGILYHYPQDLPPYEQKGNINILVDPAHQRKGIATALLKKADERWDVNLQQQTWTKEGAAFLGGLKKLKTLGGPGSGNFGHAGRPGEVGGSTISGESRERGQHAHQLLEPTSGPQGSAKSTWTNPAYKTAADISGRTPSAPLKTYKAYHVTRRNNVDALLKSGFDLSKVSPRWKNDLAVSLTVGSEKQARDYFAKRDPKTGKSLPLDEEKFALLEVTVKGRLASEKQANAATSDARDARDYTRRLTQEGYDGQDLKGMMYVNNPRAIQSIRLMPSLKSLGGPGSGNFGHAGRPGEVGGSAPSDGRAERGQHAHQQLGPESDASGLRTKGRHFGKDTLDKVWKRVQEGVPVAQIKREMGIRNLHRLVRKMKAEHAQAEADVQQLKQQMAGNVPGGMVGVPPLGPPPVAPVAGGVAPVDATDDLTTPIPMQILSKVKGDEKTNALFYIKDEQGNKYTFKPVKGEVWGDNWGPVRETVQNKKASLAEREVLTSRIDEALGLNVTTSTKMVRLSDGDVGSARPYIEGKHQFPRQGMDKGDIARMAILDALIGNTDRHANNHIENNGRIKGIDHGYAFPTTANNVEIRSWALGNMRDTDLSDLEKTTIADKLTNMDWGKVLRGSHLNAEERTAFDTRVRRVTRHLKEGRLQIFNEVFAPRTDFIGRDW